MWSSTQGHRQFWRIILLGEETSPNIGNTLWRVSTIFTRSAITPPSVNGLDEIWGTPSIFFGAGPDRYWARSAQKREWESLRKFCFFVRYTTHDFADFRSANFHEICTQDVVLWGGESLRLIANYFDHLLSLDTPTYTAAQIAKRFEPCTVLWAFHTIQPSSSICLNCNAIKVV